MEILFQKKCEACQAGAPQVSEQESKTLLKQIPDWQIVTVEKVKQLKRSFKFKNFKQAINFTNKVGEISEEEGHHPVIITEWGKVTVIWWSHKIGGLHKNDFVMAAKTDNLITAAP